MTKITESAIEEFVIEQLQELGYDYYPGPEIGPGGDSNMRSSYNEVMLEDRLSEAVARINPDIPVAARQQAVREVRRLGSPDLLADNETFHTMLTDGIPVTWRRNGQEKNDYVWLVDFDHPENNEFCVVNQYTVIEDNRNRRPDVVLFINGLPIVVMELKNATDEQATVKGAFNQLRSYQNIVSSLFKYNAFSIISDGNDARAGTLTSDFSWFMAWKSTDGDKEASKFRPQIETLVNGMLNKETLLDLVQNFIVFEKIKTEDPETGITQVDTSKKLAAYHQYYAVNKAVDSTEEASQPEGDRKAGVIWHTQGSGKSLSMVFYTGKLVQALGNPTVVVITDRNDLDDQLYETFAGSKQLLRQAPVQADSRSHLKELLQVASGGVVFTTIQKFLPESITDEEGNRTGRRKEEFDHLSDRKDIVVIADEAHRTQYGLKAKLRDVKDPDSRETIGQQIVYGFAKYMRDALPNATYIGFTGTPIEKEDKNTPAVFGNYIDIYDIADAVEDNATVRIYYESRLAQVHLDDEGRHLIEQYDRELEEDQELTEQQKAKAKWSKLEAIVGHPDRLENLAQDIVQHFEKRQEVFEGKAMIVAMSRRIAVDLYKQIIKLRPEWHDQRLEKGRIKVVMSASAADGQEMQRHHTTKTERRMLAGRMRDPDDSLKMVIVRDMWLTGFDAPSLHTMYVDKPMQGHNLMQAIARVNRVFKDKPGGLVVDYLGIASDLKKALSFYSDSGGKGEPAETQEQAVAMMEEKLEVVEQMMSEQSTSRYEITSDVPEAYIAESDDFNYKRYFIASPEEKLSIILQAVEHILGIDDGKERFAKQVTMLSKAHALSIPHDKAMAVKEEVAFFQAVKARLTKFDETGTENEKLTKDYESTIKQIVDQAISADGVVDIFDAAGLEKPDISILSEEFLMEVKDFKHKNLAFELLRKLLNDEINTQSQKNIVKGKELLKMLEEAVNKYKNGLLTTAEIIQELIELAREVREAGQRGEELGLTEEEVAFYDALGVNDSAVEVLGDETLRKIAHELAEKVKANASIDWTIKKSVRAKLKVLVRRTLNKYGYPPDKQEEAINKVIKQAERVASYEVDDKY